MSLYSKRGVSAQKEEVHAAVKNLNQGIYPQAFCKIFPDFLGGDEVFVNIMHADGAGTKSILAYLYWKETGDISVWIGTMGEGLFRMHVETGKWRRIAENPIAYFGNILSISGKDDQVWISTLNGVSRFDLTVANYELNAKIQFNNYSKKDGLGSDYIYHILIDKKNRVWFATDGAGVTVFENSAFTNFYTSGQFPASVAYSLAEDNNQHIWINTYNEGLFEYTGKHFIQYGIKNGLTDLGITAIAVDAFNNIITINKKRDRCAESSKKYCAALWR